MKRIILALAAFIVGNMRDLADWVADACMMAQWRLQGLPPLDMKLQSYKEGNFVLTMARDHPAMLEFADAVSRYFRESGGVHYVAFDVWTRDDILFTITVTPGAKDGQQAMQEVNADLMREIATLKGTIAKLEGRP